MKLKKVIISGVSLVLAFLLCACSHTNPTDDTTSNSEITEKEIVLFGGESDYRIVYSESANNNVKDLLTSMISTVKEVTGKAPEYSTDTSKSNTETPYEILLGVTKRSESENSLNSLTGLGYDVRFFGEKLVITASNDTLLAEAVSALFEAWNTSYGKITLSNKTELMCDASSSMQSLYNNGNFEYKIIVPLKVSDTLYDDAVYLSQSLSAVTGAKVDIGYDERTTEVDGAYEICLGNTTRKISQELYKGIESVFEYKIVVDGNRIAVGSLQDVVLSKAVRVLYSELYSAIKYSYSGVPIISSDYCNIGALSDVAAELPTLKAGDFYGIYQSDEDKFVIYTCNVTIKDYDDYIELLKKDGATVMNQYSFESNNYTLFSNDRYSAYVSYLPMENAIRTFVGPADTKYPLQTEATESDASTPSLWQLEIANLVSGANGGMSYVIKLTDGSFIVIDGGYNTSDDADNLYKLLKENTDDGKVPTISGWFISHLHEDHYGALIRFSSMYASSTDVKAFYYNFPGASVSASSNSIDSGVAKSIVAAMKKWKSAERYDTLHSGMTIGFAGATVDVICTHEDVYPQTFTDGNDTCTVIAVTVAGQRILFLADARDSQSVIMTNTIPAKTLKADIVQFSHHGYEGCSVGLYRTVGASVVLWPMNIIGNQSGKPEEVFKGWYNNSMAANKFIRESSMVKKIIVAGAGTEKLELPYVPNGERVPDYEAIYKERLSYYTN